MDSREIAAEYRLTHWAGIVRERKMSGASVRSFCGTNGIRENVYYYWQRKLREAAGDSLLAATSESNGLAAIPHGWAVCEEDGASASCGEVSLEIGKWRVRVGADVSAERLEGICRVLMRLC